MSQLFPLYTHPEAGYVLTALPDCEQITGVLQEVNRYCRANDIRLSFHPDQFITIASPNPAVVVNSIKELEYHGFLAELIGADIVNIHIGGVFNDKNAVLKRFAENFKLLSPAVKTRLAVENDDISYSVQDVLPLCEQLSIPMVYDVHHHRCNPDKYSIAEATDRCIEHWMALRREPHFHISSPLDGWNSSTRRSHADYIDFKDVPEYWLKLNNFTLDVEAKAKELAVTKLIQEWNDTGRLSVDC
jgi:UV DNA damage endonuclease